MRFFVSTIAVFVLFATLGQAAKGDEELRQFGERSVGTWTSTISEQGRTYRGVTRDSRGASFERHGLNGC